jgi:NADPH:quinone reductase-like Zn-dependent oxidoreductase
MKAIIYTEYGAPEVLKVSEITKPVPGDNEVLVRVHVTSVNYGDTLARNFKAVSPRNFNMLGLFWVMTKLAFGLQKPSNTILGSQFAGEVEAVGNTVSGYKAGDQVMGYLGQSMGAYAEYVCVPENAVMTQKPANMSYEEAVVLTYGAVMAINLMRKLEIQPGQKVLINGASGSIGAAAVQIAKSLGAEVTAVCGRPRFEFVKQLGADHVLDYKTTDFTTGSGHFDVIFDVLGRSEFSKCKKVLAPNGKLFYSSFKLKQLMQSMWTGWFGSQKVICGLAPGSKKDLLAVKEMAEAGKLKVVIDKVFPMEEAAQAHAYVESGHKTADVIISMI